MSPFANAPGSLSIMSITSLRNLHRGIPVLLHIRGIVEEGNGGNKVGAEQHDSLKPVGLSVLQQVVADKDSDEEDGSLKGGEVQRHGLVDDPAENDQEGGEEKGNLQRGADSHSDSQIHLILDSHNHGSHVLGGVTDNGQQNQTDEGLGESEEATMSSMDSTR